MRNIDNLVAGFKSNTRGKVISIDIDGVLFRIPIIEYINAEFGEKYTYEDFTDWNLSNFPEHIRNEMFAAFRSTEFMCSTKAYWGTYSTLRDWKLAGNKLFAITRRDPNLIDGTRYQFEKEFPGLFVNCFFVAPNESKATYLKSINADIHIDDYDVEDSVAAGIKTYLITNEETGYNHFLRDNHKLNQALSLSHVKLDDSKWLK